MTAAQVFSSVNILAMAMWILLIFIPKWKWTIKMTDYKVIPLLLSLIYAFYIIQSIINEGGMDFGSLESVMQLFTQEKAVLAGWVHYLAFDLLVGMWIVNQNKELNIHPVLIGLCLLGCFMLGPVGFLAFMIIRGIKKTR